MFEIIDSIGRSAYGFLACWPLLSLIDAYNCSDIGTYRIKPWQTALFLTCYMAGMWMVYPVVIKALFGG